MTTQPPAAPAVVSERLQLAESFASAGRLPQARAAFRSAIDVDDGPTARVAFGVFLFQIDALSEAAEQFGELLERGRGQDDAHLIHVAASNLACVCRRMGLPHSARGYQQQAISVANDELDADDLSNLAADALLASETARACDLLYRALHLHRDAGDIAGQADTWGALGTAAILDGRVEKAVRFLTEAFALHKQVGNERGCGCDLLNMAELFRNQADWKAAKHLYNLAAEKLQDANAFELATQARDGVGEIECIAAVSRRDACVN